MRVNVDSTLAEDANGARFQMRRLICRRFLSRTTRYELESGERAERIDDGVFAIIRTGEHLVHVHNV